MQKIMRQDKGIIIDCGVPLDIMPFLIESTTDIPEISGYKFSAVSGMKGWLRWMETARGKTKKPIIIDGQKWGTDIPETGLPLIKSLKEANFDAVILFPQSGPIVEYEWISAAKEVGLPVIIGGDMTHPRFLDSDSKNTKEKNYDEIFRNLGIERKIPGFIRETAPSDIYELAVKMGIRNFVLPGNKPEKIKECRELIEPIANEEVTYFSPGFIAQGGNLTESAKVAGKRFHAIVGRAIYGNGEYRKNVLDLVSKSESSV